jgi:hypothetical protein
VTRIPRRDVLALLGGPLALALTGSACRIEGPSPTGTGLLGTSLDIQSIDSGVAWLLAQQDSRGAFPSATYGLLRGGESLTPALLLALQDVAPHSSLSVQPAIDAGLEFLATKIHASGAIGLSGSVPDYPVYATAMTLHAAARTEAEQQRRTFHKCLGWLFDQQLPTNGDWAESPARGGWPMGAARPAKTSQALHVDLSMTRRALQALAAWEKTASSPFETGRRAATDFVSRSQTPDGGFVYSAASPGLNKAGPGKGYGSATCDGLLALAALGVLEPDFRIQQGLTFLRSAHRTDRNPGLEGSPMSAFAVAMKGYYRAAAAAVYARFGWSPGQAEAMSTVIRSEQRSDGSWKNNAVLQKEDDPLISTAFALQALAAIHSSTLLVSGEAQP